LPLRRVSPLSHALTRAPARSFLRHVLSLLLGAYYLVFSSAAENKVTAFRKAQTIEAIRATWEKGHHPVFRAVARLRLPHIAVFGERVAVARPGGDDLSLVDCSLYYDKPRGGSVHGRAARRASPTRARRRSAEERTLHGAAVSWRRVRRHVARAPRGLCGGVGAAAARARARRQLPQGARVPLPRRLQRLL
jgi:hypothetical protein